MTLFFIEESKEENKCKFKIKNILNKIESRIVGNKVFLTLPIKGNIKQTKVKKLVKIMEKYKIKTAVLSDKLYNIEYLKSELYSKNINILDGKYLFKVLIEDVVRYICNKSKNRIEKTEISILTNDKSKLNKEIIFNLAQKVKTLNIITNHINEFKDLEDYLYNEKGIIIKLSNNYKTALSKTNIIINIDFPQEMINKYNIPSNCIIVNILSNGIKIKSKKFNGINVNGYNIKITDKYKIKGFNDKYIYESNLLNKEYKVIQKQIVQDKIEIKNLIGEKGVINSKEYIKV